MIRRTILSRHSPRFVAVGAAVLLAAAGTWVGLSRTDGLRKDLQARFPRTPITAIDCRAAIAGLCEVTAGRNLFYATHDGRFVVVGSVIDLTRKVDVTDERLRQLAAVETATEQLRGGGSPSLPPPPAPATHIEVDLPSSNAIVHNPGAPLKIKVFSDFSCGYCRMFFTSLAGDRRFEVSEFPIAILGPQSAEKARRVLCAADRAGASLAAYTTPAITGSDCAAAAAIVEQNTAFAKSHGVTGTPTIIRPDGAVSIGFLSPSALKDFVETAL